MYSKPHVAQPVSHPFIHEAETQKDVRCIFAGCFVLNVVSKPLNWPSKISLLFLAEEFPKLLSSTTLCVRSNFCPKIQFYYFFLLKLNKILELAMNWFTNSPNMVQN